jgi:hypothetical protein
MRIRWNEETGFTYVEMAIALALSALAGVALMATNDYFMKARLAVEVRASHTSLRNLIFQTLAAKNSICPTPSTCKPVPACILNLTATSGLPVTIPASKINTLSPITEADLVELSIHQFVTLNGVPKPPLAVVTSADLNAPPTDLEKRDHLKYQVLLTGTFKEDSPTERLFSGEVTLVGKRVTYNSQGIPLRDLSNQLMTTGPDLVASIPIKFTASKTAPFTLTDCSPRTEGRPIAGGSNTVESCLAAGGAPVNTEVGNLCRFRSALDVIPPALGCPEFFTGNPGCTVDPGAEALLSATIPPCPDMTVGTDKTSGNVVDPIPIVKPIRAPDKNLGWQYCDYQGVSGGPNIVGLCPPDPNEPALGWIERTDYTFSKDTNLRRCSYYSDVPTHTYICETGPPKNCVATIQAAPPIGDGQTPVCSCPVTECPNRDSANNVISPPPWIQTSVNPAPLVCKRNPLLPPIVVPPIPVLSCPLPFVKLPDNYYSAYPDLNDWNDTIGATGNSKGFSHILCK